MWRADVRAAPGVDLCVDACNLPWSSGSVDALVLAHAMELSADPHALVRECVRVLSPRGQLVCLVFNPRAPWLLARGLRRRAHAFLPRALPPRAARLSDWLQLFDFEITALWRYGPGWPLFGHPWQGAAGRAWLRPLAWSAPGYAVLARRRALRRIPPGGKRLLARRAARPVVAR